MPQVDDEIYTITDENVLKSKAKRWPKMGPGVAPDRSPSPSFRGGAPGDAGAARASSLSMFLWGAGQVHNGQTQLGMLLLLTQVFAIAAHWSISTLWGPIRNLASVFGVSEWRLTMGAVGADFLLIVVMLLNVAQAYRRADQDNGPYEGSGNPVLAGFASLLVPGWGQILNAQVGKALVFLFGLMSGLFILGLAMLTPFRELLAASEAAALGPRVEMVAVSILAGSAALWILSVYDAVLVASFQRRMS